MNKRKILVLDDEEDYTRLVKLTLEATSEFEVLIESNPLCAIEAARSFRPDVILLDYIMPDMDGGEVARQLAADPELKATHVVYLTASALPETAGGVTTFLDRPCLIKPAPVDDIIDAIELVLGSDC